MKLRPYQLAAVDAAFKEWEDVQSTLITIPTGAGKTVCACEAIKRFQPRRTIFLCHREELAFQARRAIENYTGEEVEIEMADMTASTSLFNRVPVVVATIQTMISGREKRRMERFDPNDFGLLVCDESHHSVATSWRTVIDYFRQNKELKVLNLTATPDRADEEALGQVIDTVAYDMDIRDAINDGWLVPVDQQFVSVSGLDFSQMRTTAGDLNGADLAKVMESERVLQGVCGASIQIIGDKRTIVFTASVAHAEMACEIFNRYRPGMAGWICGATDKEERRKTMKHFGDGRLQVMCNVGCLTEGVDVPAAEIVIMGRPTKSRSLYAQMCGRILRPLPGLVDDISLGEDRKLAIMESAKPSALIVDFVGNSGRHVLVTSADILGGKVSEEAAALAVRKAVASGVPVRMAEELEDAEADLERKKKEREAREAAERARRLRLTAKVSYSAQSVSPFDVFGLKPARERGWDFGKHLSEKQRAVLVRSGIDPDKMSYTLGRQLLNETFRRYQNNLATLKQCRLLNRYGIDTKNLGMKEASAMIDRLAKSGWRKDALETPSMAQG